MEEMKEEQQTTEATEQPSLADLETTRQDHPALGMTDYLSRDFSPIFLDAARCREWIISRLHSSGYACPTCKTPVPIKDRGRYLRAERIRCASCRRQFTAWTETWMSASKLDPREIVLITLLTSLGCTTGHISHATGRSANTVIEWRRLLTP